MSDDVEIQNSPAGKPTCGQPDWNHNQFYCGPGCPLWQGKNDDE